MSISRLWKRYKRLLEVFFFLAVMGLTFYTVFHGQDLGKIVGEIGKLAVPWLFGAVMAAVFFVSMEGVMIFYLLRSLNGKSGLFRCISYSFIGFFYSGITPSATGGQPVQLYYMKRDGNRLSDSSVVLMTVALIYKFVLVICGAAMLIFWYHPLAFYLQGYLGLFLLGLGLNLLLVGILLGVMLMPERMKNIICKAGRLLERIKVWKPSAEREQKVDQFIGGYQEALEFLRRRKGKILAVTGLTFLQRFSMFFLTYIIYRGFALQETDMVTVVLLQASVYIAVDMLPVPGAQGITEMMYQSVFRSVFPGVYLTSSLLITRGISFYILLLLGMIAVIWRFWSDRRKDRRCKEGLAPIPRKWYDFEKDRRKHIGLDKTRRIRVKNKVDFWTHLYKGS